MTRKIRTSSRIADGSMTEIDPYETNPLADDYAGVNPVAYGSVARLAGPPPKLFNGGPDDLPPVTASGMDPAKLLELPYTMRHAAAAEPDPSKVHDSFELAADDPDAVLEHEGLSMAIARVRN